MWPIVARLINFCWFFFKWGIILGTLSAVVAVAYFYNRLDEEIRCRLLERYAAGYPNLKVALRSAEIVKGEGILMRGLSIVEPAAEGPHAELLYFDEVHIACSTDLQELLSGEPDVRQVVIRRPTIWITHRPDGSWSAGRLLPIPKLGPRVPPLRIEDGTVEIFDPLKEPSSTLTLRDVNLTLEPPPPADASGVGPDVRRLRGVLHGDHFRQMEVEGLVDPHKPQWSISGTLEQLDISPALCDVLPGSLMVRAPALRSLRAEAEFGFRVSNDGGDRDAYRFEVGGQLTRGRIDDPRLPHPLTDVRANFRADNQGYAIDDLSARSGQSALQLSLRQTGFQPGLGPMQLSAEVRQLELDRQLMLVLPPAGRDLWYRYQPQGQVDVTAKLAFDGKTWQPELGVRCQNASFSYYKFPYRLECGSGALDLKGDVLRLNLTAQSADQPIRLSAEVAQVFAEPCGWFEARGDDLPLDEKLLLALPERNRHVVRALNLRGGANFWMRLWRQQTNEPLHAHLVAQVSRGALRYEKFPYPLNDLRGLVEMFDWNWTFREVQASNGTGRITGEGYLKSPAEGSELFLRIAGGDVPLEQELRDALQPGMRQMWDELRPRGTVDLATEVRFTPASGRLELGVQAEPHSENTWIEPTYCPYRLEKLHGTLTYRDGQLRMDRIKAEHGLTKLSGTGLCEFHPDGSWRFHLDNVAIDRLAFDRDLTQALPGRLRSAAMWLNPTAPVNVRGELDFQRGPLPGDPLQAQWGIRIGLQRGGIDCGVRIDNLHGELGLSGVYDAQGFRSRGELAFDSFTCKDVQFTQVMGPVWIDDQQVLLGAWVDRPLSGPQDARTDDPNRRPRSITGNVVGGTVCGDAWIALAPTPRYQLQATLTQADLAACVRELSHGAQKVQGRVLAKVDLRGTGRTTNDLAGSGEIRLREANIYELPAMVSLLKILSIREPDSNAFSQSDIDFRVAGNHVYFDRLDFKGDAISLEGKGEMNFEQQIQLTFHAMVGRNDVRLPFIHEVLGGASQQLMLLHVGGTLHDPQIDREAFPGVNQALQLLRPAQK